MDKLVSSDISIPETVLADFCRRWHVAELALFGSVLRDDFGPESYVDLLVSFAPDAPISLFDLTRMERELQSRLGREVDLVEKEGLRNPFRRREILATCRSIITSGRLDGGFIGERTRTKGISHGYS